ncbi:MAG: hypothetical protein FWD38_03615 [Oscillospiraceae bacterium]|nr:hypothetical protein [Oscillospiraceae bacterium]
MFKEILRKISTRILYIIFAVIVSITLWVYVEITENDIQTNRITGIDIIFKNEDVLRDRGFLITSYSPEQLTISFEAPRSEMARLAAPGALSVEVDLASISSTGPSELVYEIIYPSGVNTNVIEILGNTASRITVTVDRKLDRQLQVVVNYTGGLASDDLVAETAEFDPRTITVWGPERLVSKISYVRVPILRENLASTYREELEFELMDENDEVLELDESELELLEFSHETIYVTIPINVIKDIPLTVNFIHGESTSDNNITWHIDPTFVKVSGDPLVIRDLNNFLLGTIDMMSFGLTDTEAFPIIIPNHITNISGETEAIIHIEVRGLEIAFRSTSNLHVINTPPGHTAEILTQSLDIRLRGSAEELALVTQTSLRVVADLADRGPGTARIPARVYIDGVESNIDPVGDYEITVTIAAE